MFLVVRSLRLGERGRDRVIQGVVVASAVLATGAVIEVLAPGTWLNMATGVLEYETYVFTMFGVELAPSVLVQTTVGPGVVVTRAGSFMFDYLQLGFFLLPAFGILFCRVAGAPRQHPRSAILLALIGTGILATVTRTAILAAGLTVLVSVLATTDDSARRRLRRMALAVMAVGLVITIPTGIAARMLEGLLAADSSTSLHVQAISRGLAITAANPLGVGIGSTAEVGARTEAASFIVENAYLDLAIQVGLVGLAAFLAFLFVVGRALWARLRRDPLSVPMLAVLAGMAVGSVLLHVWLMFETNWIVFALVGMVLPRPR